MAKKIAPKKKAKAKVAKTKAVKKVVKKAVAKKPAKKVAPKKAVVKKATSKKVAKKIPAAKAAPKVAAVSGKKVDFTNLISPLDDRVLVQIEKAERITPGGIIIPDTSDVSGNIKAKVVAVGRGHLDKKGKIRPLEIQVGNMVLLSEYAGDEVEISGHKLKILRESDLLGVVEK
jgi:chaperonin GroES